jgi:hypothetical protein
MRGSGAVAGREDTQGQLVALLLFVYLGLAPAGNRAPSGTAESLKLGGEI